MLRTLHNSRRFVKSGRVFFDRFATILIDASRKRNLLYTASLIAPHANESLELITDKIYQCHVVRGKGVSLIDLSPS